MKSDPDNLAMIAASSPRPTIARALKEIGISVEFVQDNHSLSSEAGVLRGLHFQCPPAAQDKLVRVISGSVYDVIVDIREGSKNLCPMGRNRDFCPKVESGLHPQGVSPMVS